MVIDVATQTGQMCSSQDGYGIENVNRADTGHNIIMY